MSAEKQYKYPSINNFNKKSVFAGEWIAEEKIHGANMSFHVDCKLGSIRVARRNDFLEPEDKFYNYKQILDKICEGKDDVEAELLVLISHIVYSRVELIFDTARDMLNQNEIA